MEITNSTFLPSFELVHDPMENDIDLKKLPGSILASSLICILNFQNRSSVFKSVG